MHQHDVISFVFVEWPSSILYASICERLTRHCMPCRFKACRTAGTTSFCKKTLTIPSPLAVVHAFFFTFHTFSTFLDTADQNLPYPITPELFELVFVFVQRLIPINDKSSVYNMMIQGLNHRTLMICRVTALLGAHSLCLSYRIMPHTYVPLFVLWPNIRIWLELY